MELIKVDQILSWKPLSRSSILDSLVPKLNEAQRVKLQRDFTKYLCVQLKAAVILAIQTQSFPSVYPPLSKEYKAEKRRLGLDQGFWKSTGFLVSHVKTWYKDGVHYVGFRPSAVHPVSGEKMSLIASVLELGSEDRNIPARPLFTPLARAISRHIIDIHFRRFMRGYRISSLGKLKDI